MSQERGSSGWPGRVGFRHGSALLSPTSLPAADHPLYLRFVPPAVFGTPDWTLRGDGSSLKLLVPELGWGEKAVPLDQPSGVVGLAKLEQGLTQFLDGLEGLHPQQVFLERADEPLGTAVAFRRPDEGGRTGDAEEGDLLLEVVGHVLRSMVMPHGQTVGDRPGESAEVLAHALANRLQGLEAGGLWMRVDPDTFGGAMINRNEHRGLAFAGNRRRQVGTPHHVDRVGDDGAVMVARPTR